MFAAAAADNEDFHERKPCRAGLENNGICIEGVTTINA